MLLWIQNDKFQDFPPKHLQISIVVKILYLNLIHDDSFSLPRNVVVKLFLRVFAFLETHEFHSTTFKSTDLLEATLCNFPLLRSVLKFLH